MRKVCAVIVTYNRPQLLCRCVKALLGQSVVPDIIIYDNHSSMDTKGTLQEANLLSERVFYHYADENTGGAGGFYYGMHMAMEEGYDDLLLMDDDGYAVSTSTVAELIRVREEVGENAIVNSLVVCEPETLKLSFSIDRSYDGKEMIKRAQNGILEGFINPFNGTLVSAKVVEKIGYPRKEYFVYGDENEYTLRALRNDVKLFTAVNSLYYHPTNVGSLKKIFGFYVAVNDTPMWKTYCAARNRTHFMKEYYGFLTVAKHIVRCYIDIPFRKKRFHRVKTVTRGIRDGLHGRFDRKLDLSK